MLKNRKHDVTIMLIIVVYTIENVKFNEVIKNENNVYPEITNLVFYGKNNMYYVMSR